MNSISLNRVRYRIIVGLPYAHNVEIFSQVIAENFTKKFGGATIIDAKGYWSENGDLNLNEYTGKIHIEPSRIIETVVLLDKTNVIQITQLIKKAASYCKETYNIDLTESWIHLEQENIQCNHFQI